MANAKGNVTILDRAVKNILRLVDSNFSEREVLSGKDTKLQSLINSELERSKGITPDGNVVDWITAIVSSNNGQYGRQPSSSGMEVDSSDLFTKNIGDIFGYFKDVYKNKFLEMADLKFISKFIPSMGEAVKVTIESIVSSDNMSTSISRSIILPASITDEEKSIIMQVVEQIEEEESLLRKLKDIVYKKTLVTGSFYVYNIAYSELYGIYQRLKDTGKLDVDNFLAVQSGNRSPSRISSMTGNGVTKNFNLNARAHESTSIWDSAVESITDHLMDDTKKGKLKDRNAISSEVRAAFESVDIKVYDPPMFTEALEEMKNLAVHQRTFNENVILQNANVMGDIDSGVKSIEEYKKDFDVSGTYLKYIDAKNIIPIEIFNQVVGYYHIHVDHKTGNKNGVDSTVMSISNSIFSSTNMTEKRKENAVGEIADAIAMAIIQNFSPEFVNRSSEYKQLIADCILANGIIDNEYRIQFIPSNNVVEFKINEDEEGKGESMLSDALFPAKLLLSLLVCKMLNYMNKSGNKTIAHIAKGPIDVNTSNQLQRVTRMLQESQITFNDLLSTNMIFSKFTRDGNIQLPTSKGGTKLVEFETQEGQDIQMDTEFERWLENLAILGTGVPTVIMEYVNQADFAKQIDSANIRWAGRVSNYQSWFETRTTLLYRNLIRNTTSLSDDLKMKVVNSLKFVLPRPKVLVNANNSEFLQTLQGLAQTVATLIIGENTTDENDNKLKDKIIEKYVRANSPFFDWEEIDVIVKQAKIELIEDELKAPNSPSEDDSGGF